jgi:protein-S-isoprenylcysteine O-methyltransferase Ste14
MVDMTQLPPRQISRMRHSWIAGVVFAAAALVISPALAAEEVFEWAGLFLTLAGVGVRCACTLYIGGHKERSLVSDGPYSVTRNPLYVGSFLGVLGMGLSLGSLSLAALMVGAMLLYYPHVVGSEEARLQALFGKEFDEYAARVPRWLPRLSLWQSRYEISVRPYLLMRTLRDCGWWLLVLPLSELVHWTHEMGWIPTIALP